MRALLSEHYEKDKGFTTADMIAIVNRLTKKDYTDFYDRYVFGTEVPDYDRIFGYAGFKLEKKAQATPDFGFSIRPRNSGYGINGVETGGSADKAGLKIGDVITKVNGESPFNFPFQSSAGKEIKLTVSRDGQDIAITMKVGSREFIAYNLTEMSGISVQQKNLREGWLKR